MGRSAYSYGRQPPRFKPQPTVLVICEDSKSGKRYLEDAARHFRAHINVQVIHCGDTAPKGIVAHALGRAAHFERVFCVIDRDSHETFDEAMRLAAQKPNVEPIVSHPCFEFWLLLHFGRCTRPYAATGSASAAQCLIADLKKKPGMTDYDKAARSDLFKDFLGAPFERARNLSPRILADAKATGALNPSTQLHELLDVFEQLSRPEKIG